MKSLELFCASPASTAICSTTDHRAMIRHRHVHRLGEPPRSRTNAAPCSSQLPFEPSRTKHQDVSRRRSSADVHDLANSSRYLLSDKPFFVGDGGGGGDKRLMNLDGVPPLRSMSTRSNESPVFKTPSSVDYAQKINGGKLIDHLNAQKSSLATPNRHQVVELRVSIHCKGCEGKLRKHISRMEGVTSFSIDLETKKVRVMGNVTPVGVLASISKVKNAQFWPSPSSSFSSSSSPRVSIMAPSPRASLSR